MAIAVSVIKTRMDAIFNKAGTDEHKHYISQSPSWRIKHSTLLEYKGNRTDLLKPLHLKEVQEYFIRHLDAVPVTNNLEVDDVAVMECYEDKENSILCAIDKDAMGTGMIVLNPDKMDVPQNTEGLGKLWINDKKEVKGWGRKWFYYQCLAGDSSDNYKPHCFSDVKWGDKSAYNALDGCSTDKECWQSMKNSFLHLYPQKKEVTGWRGDIIEIDWKYVLQEMVNMAHMLRWEGDVINVDKVLKKMGVV